MTVADHGAMHRIWRNSDGIILVAEDSRRGIDLYLARNRGLCFVAAVADEIVGTVLCGHDGRRGILRHLAVKPRFRNRGIGSELARACMSALSSSGIRKCNLYVMKDNPQGMRFWKRLGYKVLAEDYSTLQAATAR
jgi:ribosomal protein S18 acetylase RimI-like enzyme